MTLDAKDALSTTAGTRPHHTRTARPARHALRLGHALLLVALGGWLLAHGMQTLLPDARLPTAPAYFGANNVDWAAGALLLGFWLLIAAMALPNGRARAWASAAVGSLAALALVVGAWSLGGGDDWLGALFGLATVVVLAAPSARELYLNER